MQLIPQITSPHTSLSTEKKQKNVRLWEGRDDKTQNCCRQNLLFQEWVNSCATYFSTNTGAHEGMSQGGKRRKMCLTFTSFIMHNSEKCTTICAIPLNPCILYYWEYPSQFQPKVPHTVTQNQSVFSWFASPIQTQCSRPSCWCNRDTLPGWSIILYVGGNNIDTLQNASRRLYSGVDTVSSRVCMGGSSVTCAV